MAKLPENFVKSPAATSRLTTGKPTAGKQTRRTSKTIDLEAAAGPHVHEILLRLSPDEHAAVAAACAALAAVGEAVSLEAMIKQVIARWIAATRALNTGAPATPATAPVPWVVAHQPIKAQLLWLADQPLRRWRALGETVRRWTRR
jgi:hypothetical protein